MRRVITIAVVLGALLPFASTGRIAEADPVPLSTALQDPDLRDRPVGEIVLVGLERVDEQTVRNNIRVAPGDPFDPVTVGDDVRRLTRLAQFRTVTAEAERLPDGTVRVIYAFIEQPIIQVVQVVGNKLVSDQELRGVIRLTSGDPRDDFRIQNSKRAVEEVYRKRGHFLTTVTVDESELETNGILIFRILEGPRVKIRAIDFEGNVAFDDKMLRGQVKTREAMILFRKGALEEDIVKDDLAALDEFYKDNGFLDVRVDYEIQLSPNNREAKIVFFVEEGRLYRLARVIAEDSSNGGPPPVFAVEQIISILEIKPGDTYRRSEVRQSIQRLRNAYLTLGYLDVAVQSGEQRSGEEARIDLILLISAGAQYRVGLVEISGNALTKDKVVRRDIRLDPGRTFNGTEIEETNRRLQRTRLFNDVRITLVEPTDLASPYRDVLVEVKERDTGSVNFGAAIGSDSGVFGEISVNQSNFDVADPPASFNELIRGRAFRGAGQRFSMVLRPGNELFEYGVSLTEPHFLESDYSISFSGSYYQRRFSDWDERRIPFSIRLGRKIGDFWNIGASARISRVELYDIDRSAPTEVFASSGPDTLTGIGVSLVRSTIRTIDRPGEGSRFELSYERVGAFGTGDYQFDRVEAEYTVLLTILEDVLGRRSILRLTSRAGYLFGRDTPPTYERWYLGGRSFRGFDFRTVSPKGIAANTGQPTDDPVGGEWLFFAGAQYEFPLVDEALTGVVFIDSGTVTDDVGFSEYRLSIGTGIRLYIPAFGPLPLAFDFAVALMDEDLDETQVFSFSAEFPF